MIKGVFLDLGWTIFRPANSDWFVHQNKLGIISDTWPSADRILRSGDVEGLIIKHIAVISELGSRTKGCTFML